MKTSSRYVAYAGLALTVTVLVGSVRAAPVVANGPIDRDVVFTVGNGVLGFDRSVGTLGALVSMPSSADGGEIEPSSSYPGPYNFYFQIESLLLQDHRGGNTAHRVEANAATVGSRISAIRERENRPNSFQTPQRKVFVQPLP